MTTPPSPGLPGISAENTSFNVVPGNAVEIALTLSNPGELAEFFQIAVLGIPPSWISTREPVTQVPARQQVHTAISIHPPATSQTHAGRIPFSIRAVSQADPTRMVEMRCMLTVAAIQVEGRIAILIPAPQYTVTPGESVAVPIMVVNQGLVEDQFRLTVEGIPNNWLSQTTPLPSANLKPREQKEFTLQLKPPRSPQSRAGRHTLVIRVAGAQEPDQAVEARLALIVAPFRQFRARLEPERIQEGLPARISVGNLGNMPETFTVLYQSPDARVAFDPGQMQELRVNPGEAQATEVRPRSAHSHLVGGEYVYPYRVQVRASEKETLNLSGEVLGRGLIPGWLLPIILLACLALTCSAAFLIYNNWLPGSQRARASQTAEAMIVQIISATQTALAGQGQGSTQAPGLDSDGDGLPDAQELAFGTDPQKADTDGDGINDKAEIDLRTDPTKADTDGDGLSDGEEARLGTDPLKMDTDGDKLSDGDELRLGTDPRNSDSDNDKLLDGDEIAAGTNPLIADTDGDGLLDGDEIAKHTDPKNPDTDNDKLSDGKEVSLGLNPLNPDTDGDGVIDSADPDPLNTITVTATATTTPTASTTPTPPSQTPTQTSTSTVPAATATATPTPTKSPVPSTATSSPIPSLPSLPGALAFESNRDGNPEIYANNPANASIFRLTISQGIDTQPAWSPDRAYVAFTTNRDGNNEIYVINADGSYPVNISNNPADDQYPTWSPDGQWIAFTSNRDGNQEIYAVKLDGTGLHNITNQPGDDFQPSWFTVKRFFSSEEYIVFVSNRSGNNEIFSMKTDGSEQTNLSHNPANDFYPSGSPQGDRIAFSSNRSGNSEIYVMNTDGTAVFNLTSNPAEEINPSWAPDARWIAFVTNRDGNQEVYIMRSDGTSPTNFTRNDASDIFVNWR